MSAIVEGFAAFVIGVGMMLCVGTIADPMWERTSPESGSTRLIYDYNGLWTKCGTNVGGEWLCNGFDTWFLNLDPHVQAGRAFGLTSLLFALLGFILELSAVRNLPCASRNEKTRNRIRVVGALVSIVACILIAVGVGWYAKYIGEAYYIQKNRGSQNLVVFGRAIFLGIASAIVLLLGSFIGFGASCVEEKRDDVPAYRPAAITRMHKEYV